MAHTSEDVQSVKIFKTDDDGSSQGNRKNLSFFDWLNHTVEILHKVLKSLNAPERHVKVKG